MESLNALQFPIDIASLSRVEEKIADDFSVPDFVSLGNGSFLRFLAQHDAAIKALGGSTIGSQYNTNSSKRQHILELMSQVKDKSNVSMILVKWTNNINFPFSDFCYQLLHFRTFWSHYRNTGMWHCRKAYCRWK